MPTVAVERLVPLAAAVIALCAGPAVVLWGAAAEPNPGAAKPRAQVGAYYFDGWAGRHKDADKADWAKNAPTHLTLRMLKEFPDREPAWGWRDDSLKIMERQIDLAADHGLAFFAFDWYFQDKEEDVRTNPLHTGLELFLKARNNGRMKFCLLVANHAALRDPRRRGVEEGRRLLASLSHAQAAPDRRRQAASHHLQLGGGDKAGFGASRRPPARPACPASPSRRAAGAGANWDTPTPPTTTS